jgi:hypothetical protein
MVPFRQDGKKRQPKGVRMFQGWDAGSGGDLVFEMCPPFGEANFCRNKASKIQ